ncbi:MAG: GMC family oxidoreductase N-terminal domain-containing protein [Nocardioidaceae bacterium]|nr:GMC family oxidoreductase N-terminal domain-containing protein [Nocardioidaceae bacterium]
MPLRKTRPERHGVYDYIVVGAGSGGSAVAARLARNPAVTVLLVEAGGSDFRLDTRAPAAFGEQFHKKGDWDYFTQPEPAAANREIHLPRAKVVGGCSAMNAMLWVRGSDRDFDGWGIDGWSWSDVAPVYDRMEWHFLKSHNQDGPMRINRIATPDATAIAFVEAAVNAGIVPNDDISGPDLDGVALAPTTTVGGRRWSTARGYLDAAIQRPNFDLMTKTLVDRVLITGGRAVGIEVTRRGATRTIAARGEVVLSAGAYNTPQLLQLSGIGDASQLRGLGIDVVVDNPQVGAHLKEHPFSFTNFELNKPWKGLFGVEKNPMHVVNWLRNGTGPLASNVAEAIAHVRTREGLEVPDMQLVFAPAFFWDNGEATHDKPALSIMQSYWEPRSTGHVRITSKDPRAAPDILMNMLADPADVEALMRGIELTRRIVAAAPYDEMVSGELNPGPGVRTPEQLERFIRETTLHTYHPACTAGMGRVLDERLRVEGVAGLRVADASALPEITHGNTNAPAILFGERCADFIAADAQAR